MKLCGRWLSCEEGYTVQHEWGYEPWVLMQRTSVPLFDEAFRGYGMNKITWSAHIAALGFTFKVHPHAFMVHQPHQESSAKEAWRKGRTTTLKSGELLFEAQVPQRLPGLQYEPTPR